MAHEGIFATSDEIKFKAGSGVNSTGASEANINQLALEIEGFVNTVTRTNYSDSFAALNSDVQGILKEIETNYCGYFLIAYDNSGYNSQREAENLMNTCWARFIQCIGLIKNQESVTFINQA